MKKWIALLLVLLLAAAFGAAPAEKAGTAAGSAADLVRNGGVRLRADSEGSQDDDDDDDDDDGGIPARRENVGNSGNGGNGINPSGYIGTLSGYEPRRVFEELNWSPLFFNEERPDGEPEYEVLYADGKLQWLEVEIEWDDAECEVTFDSERNIIRAEYETEDGEIYFDGREWHDEDGNEVDGPDLSFMRAYFDRYKIPSMWYGYNTMSLIGLSLRDMYPDLTKKWYQVVPVDLTQEGVFNFPTAVSNLFYFGGCTVTIRDGNVTTDYHIPRGEAYPKSDCLMWFTDIGEITSEFLNNPRGSYQFGQPVSIREDLKGRDIALLFICNQITYRDPLDNVGGRLRRYYRGNEQIQEKLRDYESLFERMQQSAASGTGP